MSNVVSYNAKKITSGNVSKTNINFSSTINDYTTSTSFEMEQVNSPSELDLNMFTNTNDSSNVFFDGLKSISDAILSTGASVANTAVAITQGVGEFGEALVDGVATIGTAGASIGTGVYDGIKYVYSKITGADFSSTTKAMWDNEKAFVAKEHVKDAYTNFHENNIIGKTLDEHSFSPFKSTGAAYQVADRVGYIGGVVALSAATAGAGSALTGTSLASTSVASLSAGSATVNISANSLLSGGITTIAGLGKNSSKAWNDGASTTEGLAYGIATGTWEGLEMAFGSAINSLKLGIGSGIQEQLVNTGAHVALDSIDGATSAFIEPLLQTMITPNSDKIEDILKLVNYDKNGNQIDNKTWDDLNILEKWNALFEYNGGVKTVAIDGISAGIMSFLTEISDIKNSKNIIQDKQKFIDNLSKQQKKVNISLSDRQRKLVQNINYKIKIGEPVNLKVRNSNYLNTEMLKNIDDLSKVNICIESGFRNLKGEFKSKYNNRKYLSRVTYTGYEALSIIKKLEELTARVDMNLPTVERAYQIYDMLSKEYSFMSDYSQYAKGHEVAASLKGLTANNAVGKSGLVCAGFSQAYKELCERCGIKCEYIRGRAIIDINTGKGGGHAWNVVIGDNGEEIPVDVTWKTSGRQEWFGKSEEFAQSHIADSDELYKDYKPSRKIKQQYVQEENLTQPIKQEYKKNIVKESPSEISLKNVYNTLIDKYGEKEAMDRLKKYIKTGNANLITRENNARNIISGIDNKTVAIFISTELSYKNFIETIIDAMDNKYGPGTGLQGLKRYLETGSKNAITKSEGARELLDYIPLENIKRYLSNR